MELRSGFGESFHPTRLCLELRDTWTTWPRSFLSPSWCNSFSLWLCTILALDPEPVLLRNLGAIWQDSPRFHQFSFLLFIICCVEELSTAGFTQLVWHTATCPLPGYCRRSVTRSEYPTVSQCLKSRNSRYLLATSHITTSHSSPSRNSELKRILDKDETHTSILWPLQWCYTDGWLRGGGQSFLITTLVIFLAGLC